MDRAVIADLVERVRAAEGSDPRLDQMLFAAFWGWSYPLHGAAWDEFQRLRHEGRLTASIDAALTAAERFRDQGIDAATLLHDALDRLGRDGFRPDQPLAPQLARAVLIELLTALSEGGSHAG